MTPAVVSSASRSVFLTSSSMGLVGSPARQTAASRRRGPLVGGDRVCGQRVGEPLALPARGERLSGTGLVVDDERDRAVGVPEGDVVEVRGRGRGDAYGPRGDEL